MKKQYIDINDVFKATDGGLDIITSYYPEAQKCIVNKNAKFKIRDERTPSATLYKNKDVWYIKDFGSGQKAINAIDLLMQEENLSFKEALNLINNNYNLSINNKTSRLLAKPNISTVSPPEEFTIEFKNKFSEFELRTLGVFVTEKICTRYKLKPVKFYINTKGYKISSTDEYPIYCFDYGTWKKIYQPLSTDKNYRFFYVGKPPSNYIFGLDVIQDAYNKLWEEKEDFYLSKIKEEGLVIESEKEIKKEIKKIVERELKDIIICAGGRDALNVASLGYNVIWFNSETVIIDEDQYETIKKVAKQVYNLPDIDDTGIKQARELALKYLDIHTIWLPEELKEKKDSRGYMCKDITDFIEKFPDIHKKFIKLKRVALPLRFWTKRYNKDGEFKGYYLNVAAFYEFLKANGFYRIPDKTNKFGYTYARIKERIVERIDPALIKSVIKDFVNRYLESNLYPIQLRNTFYKSRQTDETLLSNLPLLDNMDFESFGKDYQYWFFNNVAWKITKSEIKEIKIDEINKYIWKDDIKNKCSKVYKTEVPLFEISYSKDYLDILKTKDIEKIKNFSELDKYNLIINDEKFSFLRFIINTSKIHWRKEEQGFKLSSTEIKEQKLHFINKIYALGYLAHKYKEYSKAWAVFAMDAIDSDLGTSYGGSGKSIWQSSIDYINRTFYIGGRNPLKFKDNFIFDGIDEHTYNVHIDDADENLNFDFFYPIITGKMNINPKNNKPFTLNFSQSPKFSFTSNFAVKKLDPSTERRILFVAFSDYYHKKDNNGVYNETRTPNTEFGKDLFTDFNEDEWNKFYNLMALAIQTYLCFDEIKPPMEKIKKRNLKTQMGKSFFDWASDFFTNEKNLNTLIEKSIIYEDFKKNVPRNAANLSINRFKKKIQIYCEYNEWIFNPDKYTDKTGRIIERNNQGKTVEYFYICAISDEMPF